jgi:hypothetical protein
LPATASASRASRAIRLESAADCATITSKASMAGRIRRWYFSPRASDFSERRALIAAIGTPRVLAACIRLGHTSVSMISPHSGRCTARKRPTHAGRS